MLLRINTLTSTNNTTPTDKAIGLAGEFSSYYALVGARAVPNWIRKPTQNSYVRGFRCGYKARLAPSARNTDCSSADSITGAQGFPV
jgi:hypothetical protein